MTVSGMLGGPISFLRLFVVLVFVAIFFATLYFAIKRAALWVLRDFLRKEKLRLLSYSYSWQPKRSSIVAFSCANDAGLIRHGRAEIILLQIDVYWNDAKT